ncbi:MAG: hypothetical protein HDS67_06030 [Bacteroidales bacterium]|nr:hypothetical protein [Bacteroidales bacterium]MBD5284141.1 hypothetical protein [Bacteroides sp.]
MDINNLSEQAKQAAAQAKAAGASSLSNAKEAISEGLESLKDKVSGDNSNIKETLKEKAGEVLQKGAEALEGLAGKLKS